MYVKVNPCKKRKWRSETEVIKDTVLERKQLVIGATLISVANISVSRQFIHQWRC